MPAAALRVPRTRRGAAKLVLAASSVARYASMLDGHGHLVFADSLRDAGFSRPASTRATEGDR